MLCIFRLCVTLWRISDILCGIHITDIGERRYLFKFFNAVDLYRVLNGTPWFFKNHLLIMKKVLVGEDPLPVPLDFVKFWIQIHDLPSGFMSESLARQFGDFLGRFLGYDSTVSIYGSRNYMRIKAKIDSRLPLKRKKKIQLG